eukprot:scaffold3789_cov44-Attheya_sp.AAC.8
MGFLSKLNCGKSRREAKRIATEEEKFVPHDYSTTHAWPLPKPVSSDTLESEESEPTPTTQQPSISTHEDSDELLSEDDDYFLLTLDESEETMIGEDLPVEDTAVEEPPAPTSEKQTATEKSELVPTGDEGLDNKKEEGTFEEVLIQARDDHDEVESTTIKEEKLEEKLHQTVRQEAEQSVVVDFTPGDNGMPRQGQNTRSTPSRSGGSVRSFKSSGGSSRSLAHVRSSGYGQVSPSEYAPNGSNRKLNTGLRVERKLLTFEEVKARNEKRHNSIRSTGYGKLSPAEYNGGSNRSLNGGSNRSLNVGDKHVGDRRVPWY